MSALETHVRALRICAVKLEPEPQGFRVKAPQDILVLDTVHASRRRAGKSTAGGEERRVAVRRRAPVPFREGVNNAELHHTRQLSGARAVRFPAIFLRPLGHVSHADPTRFPPPYVTRLG